MAKIINMHEAKTHLSRLANEVLETGEPFVIARAGVPCLQVSLIPQPKPVLGARAKEYAGIDTDQLDALDADLAAMFVDKELSLESPRAARH